MLTASPVWTPLKYDSNGLKEVHSKFFNPLKNTYSFFQMYANVDGIDINDCDIPYEDREEIDKWLLSKYNKLIKNVTTSYDKYDLNEVVKYITTFVSEDLSNWYIRRNRNRFWGSELNNSKKAVYMTTYEVLTGICKICAPIIPYITEEIYKDLTGKESVHLADFPLVNESYINEEIETKMDLVRDLISLGRNAREDVKIKVRQPISEVIIDGKNENLISDLVPLIEEELNVKKVTFVSDLSNYMNFEVKPNFKVCGKLLGSNIKVFQEKLTNLTDDEINSLENGKNITIEINSEELVVTPDMVELRVSSKDGFNASHEGNLFIILNTKLDDKLIEEGIARELVSKVQNLRKESNFNIIDRINLYYQSDELVEQSINDFEEFIKKETLAISIEKSENVDKELDLNGHNIKIKIERR